MSVVLEHRYVPRGTAAKLFECRDAEVLMAGPAGTGKAQPLDATVWTPTGPRQMRDLGVGDLVVTPDGGSAPIVGIPFRGQAPVYRVTFSDGTQVECSDGHLWQVAWRDTSERQHERVLSLAALMNMGLRKRKGTRPKFWIPQTAPVEFDPQPVPIPAYTLGVLLGDGYLRDREVSFTTADQQMADRVAAEVAPRYKVTKAAKPGNAAAAYRICPDGWRAQPASSGKAGYVSRTISGKWMARLRQPGKTGTEALYIGSYGTPELAQAAIDERAHEAFTADQLAGTPGLQTDLEQLGLRNARSATKFVPDVYKLNSVEVRWAVLQGLMDTDGYAERTTVSFTSISQQLAEDVRWLVESLGGSAQIRTKQPPNGELAYTVWIRLPQPEEAFSLDRKRARVEGRQVPVRRWIESVEYVGEQECQCITVGAPEGLYLTDGFVATHNSRSCLEKLHLMCLMNPGMRALIVRKTQVSLGSTALVTWEKAVVLEALQAGDVKFYGGGPKEPASYRYSNGSVVVIGGMDKSIRIMSSEYDAAYVQEATELTENDWESITTRLRNGKVSFQQLIADCNPDTATHWLKVRADTGRTTMFESRHEENPVYFDDDGQVTEQGAAYMAKLDALTGVRYYRLRKGMWVSAEGVIYEEFDQPTHLVDKFKIPPEWPRYWTVDFGYTNPFVLQCWAEDPDGRLYLYRELYRTKRLVEDHAADILAEVSRADREYKHPEGQPRYAYHGRIWHKDEPKPRAIICDHDAEDRATLERHLGMSTRPAHKTVSDGIQAVQSRLKAAGDGKPRLFLLRDARVKLDQELKDAAKPTCTAEEIPGYVWDTANGKKTKEDPLKEDDHGCDAMRYMVAEKDLAPKPRVRVMGGSVRR